MDAFIKGILYVHIAAGFASLLAGAVAIGTKKGGFRHRQTGRIYSFAMLVVTFSAIGLSLVKNISFLLMIALFSGYMTFTGYRALQFRRKPLMKPTYVDRSALLLGGLFVGWMAFSAVQHSLAGGFHFDGQALVLGVFATVFATFIGKDFRQFRRQLATRNDWLLIHIGRMCGAYIATFTAFLVVNVQFEPAFVPWLLPTFVGTPLIVYYTRKYKGQKVRLT